MKGKTTIWLKRETKEELDKLKLCSEESYNSLLRRLIPEWAIIIKTKLEEEKAAEAASSIKQNDKDKSSQ